MGLLSWKTYEPVFPSLHSPAVTLSRPSTGDHGLGCGEEALVLSGLQIKQPIVFLLSQQLSLGF